jgi:uncharacterized protein
VSALPSSVQAPAVPMLGRGVVLHRRLRPRDNAFRYGTYFLMLPMHQLAAEGVPGLPRNRFGLLSFHDADHGDGRADAMVWLHELLATEGVHDARGEIWLQTYPRVLGYVFKPVSFWHCHRSDGSLAALVAEVNNTFGERHCYLLAGPQLAYGRELTAQKVFHVSPFCRVEGRYRFRFMRTPTRVVARVDHDDELGALLQTSVSGALEPVTPAAVKRAFWGQPLMTLSVIARIHWQALKLFAKRVPFASKPTPPERFVTR